MIEEHIDKIVTWWPLLTLAGYVILGFLLWHLSKSFVKREEHEALKIEVDAVRGCVDDVSRGVNTIQHRLELLPAARDLNKILLSLEELRGTQKELVAKMNGQEEVLKRIEHPVQLLMAAHMDGGAHK